MGNSAMLHRSATRLAQESSIYAVAMSLYGKQVHAPIAR